MTAEIRYTSRTFSESVLNVPSMFRNSEKLRVVSALKLSLNTQSNRREFLETENWKLVVKEICCKNDSRKRVENNCKLN